MIGYFWRLFGYTTDKTQEKIDEKPIKKEAESVSEPFTALCAEKCSESFTTLSVVKSNEPKSDWNVLTNDKQPEKTEDNEFSILPSTIQEVHPSAVIEQPKKIDKVMPEIYKIDKKMDKLERLSKILNIDKLVSAEIVSKPEKKEKKCWNKYNMSH